jgi:hypothetical protein
MSTKENGSVRTTIVGGRPPGSGRITGTVPRGIEVMVKKAAVDPVFRELLFAQRGGAAKSIELELDPAENAMLNAIPQAQLTQIVSQTTVPDEQRRVFLGRLAGAMLALLGVGLASCDPLVHTESAGIRPASHGLQPDLPATSPPPTNPPALTRGVQPDRPTNAATNPPSPPSAGIQPHRP